MKPSRQSDYMTTPGSALSARVSYWRARLRVPVSRRTHDEIVRAMLGNISTLESWLNDMRAERDRLSKIVNSSTSFVTFDGRTGRRR